MWLDSTRVYIDSSTSSKPYSYRLRYLLEKFEDIAWINAELNGFGTSNNNEGYGWFLSRYSLSLHKDIDFSHMNIRTWPYFSGSVSCGRCFQLIDRNSHVQVEANSLWGLVDIKTTKLLNPYKTFGIDISNIKDKDQSSFVFPRIIFTDSAGISGYSDIEINDTSMIDSNDHVNNTKYMEFILKPIEQDFFSSNYITKIDIHYKKQILFNSKIRSSYIWSPDGSFTTHRISDLKTDDTFCLAVLHWLRY